MKAKSRKVPRQVRQGDVLVESTTRTIPEGAPSRAAEAGRVILAHGEVTGHAHAVAEPDSARLYDLDDVTLLAVDALTALTHDEHGTVVLTEGTHEVIRQVEYTPAEIRDVQD